MTAHHISGNSERLLDWNYGRRFSHIFYTMHARPNVATFDPLNLSSAGVSASNARVMSYENCTKNTVHDSFNFLVVYSAQCPVSDPCGSWRSLSYIDLMKSVVCVVGLLFFHGNYDPLPLSWQSNLRGDPKISTKFVNFLISGYYCWIFVHPGN
jgi:hypothetical protein